MPISNYNPLHSLYGRKLGLDKDGFLVGHPGARVGVETSTAASTLDNSGTSVLTGTTALHTLGGAVAPGVRKTIINASSVSTATMTIRRSSTASSDAHVSIRSTAMRARSGVAWLPVHSRYSGV